VSYLARCYGRSKGQGVSSLQAGGQKVSLKASILPGGRSVAFYSSPLPARPVNVVSATSCISRSSAARGNIWLVAAGEAREHFNQMVADVDLISAYLLDFEQNKSSGHV